MSVLTQKKFAGLNVPKSKQQCCAHYERFGVNGKNYSLKLLTYED